jgi:predicted HicB family RNase H-like nuclease
VIANVDSNKIKKGEMMFNLSLTIDKKKKSQEPIRSTKVVFLRLPNELYTELQKEAKTRKITIQKYIIKIVNQRK